MGMTAISCVLPQYGIGRNIGATPGTTPLNQISKIIFSGQMIYQLVLALTRLALCSFYLNIFQDKSSRRVFYALIGFTSIGFIAVEFATLFRCCRFNLPGPSQKLGKFYFLRPIVHFTRSLLKIIPVSLQRPPAILFLDLMNIYLWTLRLHSYTVVCQRLSRTSWPHIESEGPATIPSQFTSQQCYTTSSATSS